MKRFGLNDAPPRGTWKDYKKKTIVSLLKMSEPFICESREGEFKGQAGDFLAQDGHGGFYPISKEFHWANYERYEVPIYEPAGSSNTTKQVKRVRWIIAEWQKGCGNTIGFKHQPERCTICTRGALDAIEATISDRNKQVSTRQVSEN